MNTLPQIEPITRLQRDHNSILSQLTNGPVILTQRSKPAAVMISPSEWDKIAKELKRLRHQEWCDRVSREMDEDPSTQIVINSKEEWLALHE
ncbi:type II toxin-antitoxin system prevent-host-death family antitoxin [Chloroflexi bacterium TSY]|nr:type II toxin-antitoxin system prevent-host-death family antitoxin [Chloroflexi bacterium TSY]